MTAWKAEPGETETNIPGQVDDIQIPWFRELFLPEFDPATSKMPQANTDDGPTKKSTPKTGGAWQV